MDQTNTQSTINITMLGKRSRSQAHERGVSRSKSKMPDLFFANESLAQSGRFQIPALSKRGCCHQASKPLVVLASFMMHGIRVSPSHKRPVVAFALVKLFTSSPFCSPVLALKVLVHQGHCCCPHSHNCDGGPPLKGRYRTCSSFNLCLLSPRQLLHLVTSLHSSRRQWQGWLFLSGSIPLAVKGTAHSRLSGRLFVCTPATHTMTSP